MAIVDYLLLTPLDEEWRAVRPILCPKPGRMREERTNPTTYYVWKHSLSPPNSGEYLLVGVSIDQTGQSNTAIFATASAAQWSPKQTVLLGIAGSFKPEKLQLGDVVVPKQVFGFETGSMTGRKRRINFRRTVYQADELPIDRIRAIRNDPAAYEQWQRSCVKAAQALRLNLKGRPPELHFDVVGSGNYVFKSVAAARHLKKEVDSRIEAVEMEAEGFFNAIHRTGAEAKTFMVRGISDYADSQKSALEKRSKDAWRTFAAGNAARLVHLLWERAAIAPVTEPYEINLQRGTPKYFAEEAPELKLKHPGSQILSFPALLERAGSNPRFELNVSARGKTNPGEMRGKVVLYRQGSAPEVKQATTTGAALKFVIPASESGGRLALFLSLRTAASGLEVECEDNFNRHAKRVLNLK